MEIVRQLKKISKGAKSKNILLNIARAAYIWANQADNKLVNTDDEL